jgi:hypothetical protein
MVLIGAGRFWRSSVLAQAARLAALAGGRFAAADHRRAAKNSAHGRVHKCTKRGPRHLCCLQRGLEKPDHRDGFRCHSDRAEPGAGSTWSPRNTARNPSFRPAARTIACRTTEEWECRTLRLFCLFSVPRKTIIQAAQGQRNSLVCSRLLPIRAVEHPEQAFHMDRNRRHFPHASQRLQRRLPSILRK